MHTGFNKIFKLKSKVFFLLFYFILLVIYLKNKKNEIFFLRLYLLIYIIRNATRIH